MYSNPDAVKAFSAKTHIAEDLVRQSMAEFQPKIALQSDAMADLDGAIRDAVKLKFLDKPLTPAQIADFIQIPPRAK
jgi:NitT/TauT family transport system substrate-binding protein